MGLVCFINGGGTLLILALTIFGTNVSGIKSDDASCTKSLSHCMHVLQNIIHNYIPLTTQ